MLTNHLNFDATTISAIYKDRWQIEIFFKALKQNLKVKTFEGTSENALYIQIRTAIYRNLWEWIDSPYEVLPLEPKSVQYLLPLRGLGPPSICTKK